MEKSKTITVFLLDGSKENCPKTVKIGGWDGTVFYLPTAAEVKQMLKTPDDTFKEAINKPGVYFLKSSNPENSDIYSEKIYIGQTWNIKERFTRHLHDETKEDFEEWAFFTCKDASLDTAGVKYLESKFLSLAKEANSAELIYGKDSSEPSLEASVKSVLNLHIENIKSILPILGFHFLISDAVVADASAPQAAVPITQEYSLKSPVCKAALLETTEGFVVKKGSQAVKDTTKSAPDLYVKLRERLIVSKELVDKGKFLEFAEDIVFKSRSAAACVVLGRSANGLVEWLPV
ncbi:MAG: GIY-YIG nuclease family protein [Prevotellaceae bacterium]|jgi:hypothetical protein|nr:GIY-YIG nuclease family protein [Prevotellaceae bacterium]